MIAGVDEAGKGPVIGPMWVAGVMVSREKMKELSLLGVKDSKLLSPKRREFLAERIKQMCKFYLLEVTPLQIDELRKVWSMNQILVSCYSKVISRLGPSIAYVDSADVDEKRFASLLREKCGIRIISKHDADVIFPVVSAASILAKVERDRSIRKLEEEIGEKIGSGYPSDRTTRKFLMKVLRKRKIPPYIRQSWKTIPRLSAKFNID
jgi:ribonuclease HII